jgi:hypothetical protein
MIMRRPLDWFVVSISMMLLAANRMLATPPAESPAYTPDLPVAVSVTSNRPAFPLSVDAAPAEAGAVENPFAYIREDGSLQFLPAAAARPTVAPRVSGKNTRSRPAAPATALYTWSSPLILNDRGTPSFQ